MAGMAGTVHSITLVREVQRMREGGWELSEIHRLLSERDGPTPSLTSLKRWTDPARQARELCAHRRRQATKAAEASHFRWPGKRSPEWMAGRMLFLARIGISHNAIAKVMNADFGLDLTQDQVRGLVVGGSDPLPLLRLRKERDERPVTA